MQHEAMILVLFKQAFAFESAQGRDFGPGDVFRSLPVEAAPENREAGESDLLIMAQQRPRSIENPSQLTTLSIAQISQKTYAAAQSRQDFVERQQLRPLCGEPERKRGAAHEVADSTKYPRLAVGRRKGRIDRAGLLKKER